MNRIASIALPWCALALAACGDRAVQPSMEVLTVTGAIDAPGRGAFDPGTDKYFAWLGVEFPNARSFTREELAGLPQRVVHVTAGPLPPGSYEGPLLGDVLDIAGRAGGAQQIVAYALDGYSALIPLDGVLGSDPAVVAIARDGAPLPLGGIGPATIVFPDESGADDAWYVWGLVLITVE